MTETRPEPVSPELVLVCPELRAALVAEFVQRQVDSLRPQLVPSAGPTAASQPESLPLELSHATAGDEGAERTPSLVLATGAYAAKQLFVGTLQSAAFVLGAALAFLAAVLLVHL
jgi:hypothetical protein